MNWHISHGVERRTMLHWHIALALSVCSVIAFYGWITGSALSQLGNPSAKAAHYNLQVDGFLSGQLNLKKEAPPQLAQMANPYDPVQNGPYRLHDASYYKGKLYLYFGVTPVVVLFLPYAILTGHYIWHHDAVAIFSAAQFLVLVGLLYYLCTKFYTKVSLTVLVCVVLAVGLATGVPILLRRPDLWEIPIMSASLFVFLSLAFLLCGIRSTKYGVYWSILASIAYGFAIGARPSVLFGAVILLLPVWVSICSCRKVLVNHVIGAFLPISILGCGLLLYNFLRFSSFTEFGQNYQLAADNQNALRHFGLDFLWFNLQVYFWTPVRWMSYFPFIFGADLPKPPVGQFGVENPFGILTNVPFVWMGLGMFFSSSANGLLAVFRLKYWFWSVFLTFITSVIFIGCFGGACNRYQVEFLPALILIAVIGVFTLEERLLHSARIFKWSTRILWSGLLLYSVVFNFFASCEHWDLFRTRDPVSFSRLAHIFNSPIAYFEKFTDAKISGPLEFKFKLPPFTNRRVEPLLVTGYAKYADYVWVEYIDSKHLRFGIEHTSYGGPISPAIEIDYSQWHTLFIEIASLYPPKEHPFHAELEKNEARRIRTRAQVHLNGKEVLWGDVSAYDASPQTRWVGRNPWAQHLGSSFTGVIQNQQVLKPLLGPSTVPLAPGIVRMNLWLPSGKSPGLHEPLVCTGITGAGDLIYLRYVDEQSIALGFDHWNFGGPIGHPFKVDRSVPQRIEVHMGSLFPPHSEPEANDPARRQLTVLWNGVQVLSGQYDFHPAYSDQVYFGTNPIGCSTATAEFSGKIVDIWRGN